MAQHDYVIANQTGLEFRADLNNALQAIVTQNSGETEPTVTYPGMKWLDTSVSPAVTKERNQTNDGWITTVASESVVPVTKGGTGATTPEDARTNLGAQPTLVSGTNIKTINGQSLLDSGNLEISAGLPAASTAQAQTGTANDAAITPLRLREGFNATGGAPVYACRAWVNFNGTGTVAIRASGNVSSITDNGTGDYTVNFTEQMPDVDYSCCVSGGINDPSYTTYATLGSSRSTSSVRVLGANVSATVNAFTDLQNCNVAIFR